VVGEDRRSCSFKARNYTIKRRFKVEGTYTIDAAVGSNSRQSKLQF